MKSRVHSIALHLAKAATRKALAILVLPSLAVAGTGVWANKVYADKVKAEKMAQERAATLNDVMAKLNRMESEMREQTRALKEKMESIEYQNARVAAYALRERDQVGKLQLAALHMASLAAAPAPQFGRRVSVQLSPNLEEKICGDLEGHLGAKGRGEGGAEADGEGEVGAEAFGNGVLGKLRGWFRGHVEGEVGGEAKLGSETCLTIDINNVFERQSGSALQANSSFLAGGISPDVENKINALVANAPEVAMKLLNAASDTNRFGTTAASNTIDLIQNANFSLSPTNLLKKIDDPTTAFQDVQAWLDTIPLPGNLSDLFKGPAGLIPQVSDLNPANFCTNFNSGGTGLISTFCAQVPAGLADLKGITQAIGDFSNVQVDLAKLKTGVANVCGSLNSTVSNLNKTNVQVPTLASFTFVDGVAFTVDPLGVSVSKKTVTVGPATITNPIQLPTISCPSF